MCGGGGGGGVEGGRGWRGRISLDKRELCYSGGY